MLANHRANLYLHHLLFGNLLFPPEDKIDDSPDKRNKNHREQPDYFIVTPELAPQNIDKSKDKRQKEKEQNKQYYQLR